MNDKCLKNIKKTRQNETIEMRKKKGNYKLEYDD